VLNNGANKLDPYLSVNSTLAARLRGDQWEVTVTVELTNTAPDFLSTFVAGPQPTVGTVFGEYRGTVALTVPAAATDATTTGDGFVAIGDDGPTRVIASTVSVQRGETATMTFSFRLPENWDVVQIVSSARVPTATWTIAGEQVNEGRPRNVALRSLD
jgi:hypothetical protein